MNRTTVAAVALVSTLALSAAAQEPPPWTLTIPERIQARLDPKRIAMRADAAKGTPHVGFVLDGSRNPELFLPSELMSFFLSDLITGTPEHRRKDRRSYDRAFQQLGWSSAAFWSDVEVASAEYLRLEQEGGEQHRSAELSRRICAERVAVLNTLRSKYPRFDEFLYGTFAPRQSTVSAQPLSAERLLWIEEGCR